MAFSKQFPIRILLDDESLQMLIDALKGNEEDFGGGIADEARELREKIEKYGQRVADSKGNEAVRLGFYEKDGVKFIWQFIAASRMAADYRELNQFCDEVTASNSALAETEV